MARRPRRRHDRFGLRGVEGAERDGFQPGTGVMSKVIYDTSMSLDGFITGPNPSRENPLGKGGDQLHEWMSGIGDFRYRQQGSADVDEKMRNELHRRTGAIVIGRTMFDVGEEPWGADPPFAMPVFVLTHRSREPMTMQGGTIYTFVTRGIHVALEQALATADGKEVLVVGGANVARQFLEAGLLDEVHIHIVPILLGAGMRLFEGTGQRALELRDSLGSFSVTHITYGVPG